MRIIIILYLAFFSLKTLNAQSLEYWDTKPDEIFINIRCPNAAAKMKFSVENNAGGFGLGKKTYETHTPDQLYEYNSLGDKVHGRLEKGGKTISDPEQIVIRLKYSEGARYKITFDDFKECESCAKKDESNKDFRKKKYEKGDLIRISFACPTGAANSWLIDNRSGIIKPVNGYGHFIDHNKVGRSFNLTCVKTDIFKAAEDIRYSLNPWKTFNMLEPYKILAGSAYDKKLGDTINVNGHLYHHSDGGNSSNNARFELKESEKPLDYFLESGDGSTRFGSHHNYQYEFKVIDVAEGYSETFFSSIFQFLWDINPLSHISYRNPFDYRFWPKKDHPAGPVPAGFRAITCKCNCCPDDPKYVIAFAGTTAWSKSDWYSNLSQGIPIMGDNNLSYESRIAPHYEYAIKYATWVIKENNLKTGLGPKHLKVTGHSLGGGLACYVSGYFNIPGFGYNPAPLASAVQVLMDARRRNNIYSPEAYFTNVRVPLDPVSGLLPLIPYQKLIGQVFIVESTGPWGSSFTVNDHMIGSIGNRLIGYKAPMPFDNKKPNEKQIPTATPTPTPSPQPAPTPSPLPNSNPEATISTLLKILLTPTPQAGPSANPPPKPTQK